MALPNYSFPASIFSSPHPLAVGHAAAFLIRGLMEHVLYPGSGEEVAMAFPLVKYAHGPSSTSESISHVKSFD